jgi:hypothetical protein
VRPSFLTAYRFAEARLRGELARSFFWSFRRLGDDGAGGRRESVVRASRQPSVRRGAVVKLQSDVNSWPLRRSGAEAGDARAAGSRLPIRE